jgi:hypothetical protein
MATNDAKAGNLPITLATYVAHLADSGRPPLDAGLAAACEALRAAAPGKAEGLANALVARVAEQLGDPDPTFERVHDVATRIYGPSHVATDFGGSRDERLREARRYEFQLGLPWLARIYDRFPDGTVGPHWVMVERVTDVVRCMDPYPWDDLDEEYESPVAEFMVKWELGAARGLRWV